MYESLKKIFKSIVSEKLIKRNEDFIRSTLSIIYIGKNYKCNICDFKMSKFIKLYKGNKLCPKCGSLNRTRRLYWFLDNELNLHSKKILHFSPPKSLAKKLKTLFTKNYISSDYSGEFNAEKKLDITKIDEPNNSYDVIICYHVLEHIEEDCSAMKELYRVLKKGGLCIIQTPFKDGKTYENASITSKKDRIYHFGQEDHVRIYSVNGLDERLLNVGFKTNVIRFEENENNFFGFDIKETVLIAEKI
ncbi:MAG: class I SAM-dependent methyltransferase [Flavobacteriaceae bacterium]|nr:class I SAM-dependent methyltransferase [Flavobacteriaceae bacterium]